MKIGMIVILVQVFCVATSFAQTTTTVTGALVGGYAAATGDVARIGEKGVGVSAWMMGGKQILSIGAEFNAIYTSSDSNIPGLTLQGSNASVKQRGSVFGGGLILGKLFGERKRSFGATLGAGLSRSGTDIEASDPNVTISNQGNFESRDWGFYISHRYLFKSDLGKFKSILAVFQVQVIHNFTNGETQNWIIPSVGVGF